MFIYVYDICIYALYMYRCMYILYLYIYHDKPLLRPQPGHPRKHQRDHVTSKLRRSLPEKSFLTNKNGEN